MNDTSNASEERALSGALLKAALEGDLSAARDLIERGADVNSIFNKSQGEDVTPLFFASVRGNLDVVELLLEHGAHPDRGYAKNASALGYAAGQGHADVAEALLKAGADPNRTAEHVSAPLGFALQNESPDLVAILLEGGADPNQVFSPEDQRIPPLAAAAASNRHDAVHLLLEAGAEVDAEDKDNMTALAYTALNGATDIAETLLDAGASRTYGHGGIDLADMARSKGNHSVAQVIERY